MTQDEFIRRAILDAIDREGGLVLHTVPGDRGGQTYAGISRKHNPDWPGWEVVDVAPPPDVNGRLRLKPEVEIELKNGVIEFYRERYWQPLAQRILESYAHDSIRRLAYIAFDCSVNCGVRRATHMLQAVIHAEADGIWGPKTAGRLHTLWTAIGGPELVILRFGMVWLARYNRICQTDPSQRKFAAGWLNRAMRTIEQSGEVVQ